MSTFLSTNEDSMLETKNPLPATRTTASLNDDSPDGKHGISFAEQLKKKGITLPVSTVEMILEWRKQQHATEPHSVEKPAVEASTEQEAVSPDEGDDANTMALCEIDNTETVSPDNINNNTERAVSPDNSIIPETSSTTNQVENTEVISPTEPDADTVQVEKAKSSHWNDWEHPNNETFVYHPDFQDDHLASFAGSVTTIEFDSEAQDEEEEEITFAMGGCNAKRKVDKGTLVNEHEIHRKHVGWTLGLFCVTLTAVMLGLVVGVYGLQGDQQPAGDRYYASANTGVGGSASEQSSHFGYGTTCEDSIITTKSCYFVGQHMVVDFENCLPSEDDWLAVYESNANATNLGEPILWMWTCGDEFCRWPVYSDVLAFAFSVPLHPGSYRAHLLRRNSGGPYWAYASSLAFVVEDSFCGM
jgi:hypothetical protein